MKTRGGQSIVRARGHAVTRMGRGATRVDGADQGRRGGGGNRRKKISVLFWVNGMDVQKGWDEGTGRGAASDT